jgi:hypothetical protein
LKKQSQFIPGGAEGSEQKITTKDKTCSTLTKEEDAVCYKENQRWFGRIFFHPDVQICDGFDICGRTPGDE